MSGWSAQAGHSLNPTGRARGHYLAESGSSQVCSARFEVQRARYRAAYLHCGAAVLRHLNPETDLNPSRGSSAVSRNQRRTVTLTLPTLPLVVKGPQEIVCSPGPSSARVNGVRFAGAIGNSIVGKGRIPRRPVSAYVRPFDPAGCVVNFERQARNASALFAAD